MNTIFYKLRHKPSGLFFKPSTHGNKVNLSKVGKTYNKRPTIKFLGGTVAIGYGDYGVTRDWGDPTHKNPTYQQIVVSDWEIVKYEVVETSVELCK